MAFDKAERRIMADGTPARFTSDHDGKHHPFVYDAPANEDGHVINGAKLWSWVWVAVKSTVNTPDGHEAWPPARVSIWSGPRGRWLDGEVSDGAVGGDYRGWPVPAGGRTSVVSLDDVELDVRIDHGVGIA